MDDDWLPEEPATATAYELLPEWVRWNGEQIGVPGPLIERSVAVAERRQLDINDCPSFRFRPRPGAVVLAWPRYIPGTRRSSPMWPAG